MLSTGNRLRDSRDFAAVTKLGRQNRAGSLVAYLLRRDPTGRDDGPRAGLIVGKVVGNSVVRHAVSRKIRAQLAPKLETLRPGDLLVVRALAGSGQRTSAQVDRDLSKALASLVRMPSR